MAEITVGIDIGGTNTKFGVVDRSGKVLFHDRIKTAKHDAFSDFVAELSAEIKKGITTFEEAIRVTKVV